MKKKRTIIKIKRFIKFQIKDIFEEELQYSIWFVLPIIGLILYIISPLILGIFLLAWAFLLIYLRKRGKI
ncbi:MAG: hypothetical protein ABIG60_01835 [Patescibacteria group bacterium]